MQENFKITLKTPRRSQGWFSLPHVWDPKTLCLIPKNLFTGNDPNKFTNQSVTWFTGKSVNHTTLGQPRNMKIPNHLSLLILKEITISHLHYYVIELKTFKCWNKLEISCLWTKAWRYHPVAISRWRTSSEILRRASHSAWRLKSR